MDTHDYQFDFVISYASENEHFARQLYGALESKGALVFFAPEYQATVWGVDLSEFLDDMYSKQGRFCILVVSKEYVSKQWTRHELRSAIGRSIEEIDRPYVLPIRLDDTKIPGLPKITSYIDARNASTDEIAELAIQKLRGVFPSHIQKKLSALAQDVASRMLHDLQKVIGHDSATIQLIKKNGERLMFTTSGITDEVQPFLLRPISQEQLLSSITESRTPAIINDFIETPYFSHVPMAKPASSIMALPLIYDDNVIGVITMVYHSPNQFIQEQADMLSVIVNQLASVLYNAVANQL